MMIASADSMEQETLIGSSATIASVDSAERKDSSPKIASVDSEKAKERRIGYECTCQAFQIYLTNGRCRM